MYSIKNTVTAATVSALSLAYLGTAQATETVKPLQGFSLHTETKNVAVYFTAENGTCKVIVTLTDKAAYAPIRFEAAVEPSKPILRQLDDANSLEFACAPEARALSITLLATVADKR